MEKDLHKMIKGRIAETIVEELFREMGFRVFRYGMENTIPGIIPQIENGQQNAVSMRIRQSPDLVVYKEKKAYFIEVKYRSCEKFCLKDVEKDCEYSYPNAFFVVISKKHIKCISYKELKSGESISPDNLHFLLGKRPEFLAEHQLIMKFLKESRMMFEAID